MIGHEASRKTARWIAAASLGLALAACGTVPKATPNLDASFYEAPNAAAPLQAQSMPGGQDTGFGSAGRVTLDPDGRNMRSTALRVLAGGKLLVGGFAFYSSQGTDFALARLLPGGAPDPTWNGGQMVVTQVVRKDYLHGLDVQPDSRVVAVGSVSVGVYSDRQIALVRYTASGALDPTFGSGGTVLLNFAADATATEEGWGVKVLSSGKLLVAGESDGTFFLARLMPNGSLDPSFGTGGRVLIDAGEPVSTFAVGFRNGAVVLASGFSGNRVVLARYRANGTPDPNFGVAGLARITFGQPVQGGALAIQSDDRVLLAANLFADSTPYDRANIVRVRENGTTDPHFGVGGVISQPFGVASGEVNDLRIQEDDDKIIAGGSTHEVNVAEGYTLARFKLNGTVDAGFGTGGVSQLSGENASIERLALSGNHIVVSGYLEPAFHVINTQVLRFFR